MDNADAVGATDGQKTQPSQCHPCERKRKVRAQKLDALIHALDEYVNKVIEIEDNLLF